MEHLNEPREQQAHDELGRTEVTPAVARTLVAAFLAMLLLVFAVDRAPQRGWTELFAEWPNGCTLSAFERRLEDDSTMARAVRPLVQWGLVWLGAGNEQTYVGQDGWLFHRPGIDYVTGPGFLEPARLRARVEEADACADAPQPDPVRALVSFRDQLASRGIALIVVPTPLKAVLHPARFSGRYPAASPAVQNPSYASFQAALEERGLEVFDPTSLLRDADSYLATDTHWRAAPMATVARALAERIEQLGVLSPAAPGRLERGSAEVANRGDLTAMLSLPEGQTRFPNERVEIAPVTAVWDPVARPDVLLLGDSFSNVYSSREAFAQRVAGARLDWGEGAGLVEQLGYALERPVARIVRNAGGAHATREALAREVARDAAAGRDRLAGVRVVVYQFAMRELAQGDWKPVELGAPLGLAAAEPEPGAEQHHLPRQLRGRIAARSEVPRPGSVPYRDAVFALHLVDVVAVGEGAPAAPEEIVVYAFGMRDARWTAAADWKPGDLVTLVVNDWEDAAVQQRYASYNRTELDDLGLLLLPSFWAERAGDEEGAR